MRASLIAFLLVSALVAAPTALAQSARGEAARSVDGKYSRQDATFRDQGYPLPLIAQQQWSKLPEGALDALRKNNASPGRKLLQLGIERAAYEAADADLPGLQWRANREGGQTARLAVRSPGAAALRAALSISGLPDGAELRFGAPGETSSVVDPVTAAELAALAVQQPLYWTPVTDGDTQVIELYLPPGSEIRWLRVSVPSVSHLVASPGGDLSAAKIGESDVCEIDTKCVSNPSAAYTNAKNAVARIVFQQGGGSFFCTGTLLNDTDNATQVPYVFGAAHCFTSQAVASTLTTFWFYESTACRSNVLDPGARQVSGGAQVLYADVPSDVLFLRLNNAAPAGAFFLGWNATAVAAGTSIVTIHHPAGDVKKVSLGATTGIGASNLASGSFIKAGYTDGTTEGGSSGCGLLTDANGEFVLRGGLLGGQASCANSGNIGTAGNTDDYSRLDLAFPNLRAFLQPNTTQPPSSIDYSGAWSNPQQDGWGLIVIRGGSGTYAMYVYHYDQDSSPGWYLSAANLSGTSYNAALIAFTGPWFGAGFFNPAQVIGRTAGNISVNFSSATTASISFTIDGRTVSTNLARLAF
jgi:lysyl endopeptidase